MIIILLLCLGVTTHLLRNMFKTLNNIQVRLIELHFFVEEYDELVKKLNVSETYYGDTTIEAFVKMSNQFNENLKDILDLHNELTGEVHATEEEDEA